MKAADRRAYQAAAERADGRCEGCGTYAPLELHHRRFRGRGGKHLVENLVALCGSGNHTGCHGQAHGVNPPAGWAISQYERRTDDLIPFQAFDGLSWLTTDGRRILIDTTPY